jgi:hypothetical protein
MVATAVWAAPLSLIASAGRINWKPPDADASGGFSLNVSGQQDRAKGYALAKRTGCHLPSLRNDKGVSQFACVERTPCTLRVSLSLT